MAANSKCTQRIASLGKRVITEIWTPNSSSRSFPAAFASSMEDDFAKGLLPFSLRNNPLKKPIKSEIDNPYRAIKPIKGRKITHEGANNPLRGNRKKGNKNYTTHKPVPKTTRNHPLTPTHHRTTGERSGNGSTPTRQPTTVKSKPLKPMRHNTPGKQNRRPEKRETPGRNEAQHRKGGSEPTRREEAPRESPSTDDENEPEQRRRRSRNDNGGGTRRPGEETPARRRSPDHHRQQERPRQQPPPQSPTNRPVRLFPTLPQSSPYRGLLPF